MIINAGVFIVVEVVEALANTQCVKVCVLF